MASVTSKSCHSRFKVLIEAHRRANRESTEASGMAENEDELTCVLDDLLADCGNFLVDEAEATKLKEHTADDLESAGSVVRAQAIQRLNDTAAEINDGSNIKAKPTIDPAVVDSLCQYNETIAATHGLIAKDTIKWQQQFEAKLAALSEERRLDREARAEELRLARLKQEEAWK